MKSHACHAERLGTSVASDLSEISEAAPVHSPMNNSMSLTGVGLFCNTQKQPNNSLMCANAMLAIRGMCY